MRIFLSELNFPIPNVYWLGISRYEEHTTLYAITLDKTIIGLIGLGYDEDGVSGFINPLMIDEKYQGNQYAKQAMDIAIHILKTVYHVEFTISAHYFFLVFFCFELIVLAMLLTHLKPI